MNHGILNLLDNATDAFPKVAYEIIAKHSMAMSTLPFERINGTIKTAARQTSLPKTASRGLNSGFKSSKGSSELIHEELKLYGGLLKSDTMLPHYNASSADLNKDLSARLRSLALTLDRDFIKGNSAIDPTAMTGLQYRVDPTQTLSAGSDVGGSALSLAVLDEAIAAVPGANAIFMNQTLVARLQRAFRSNLAGSISFDKDELGRNIMIYSGIPIHVVGRDPENAVILDFSESDATDDTPTCSSIYVARLGEDGLVGIFKTDPQFDYIGPVANDDELAETWALQWMVSMFLYYTDAVSRIQHISDAAITE